MACDFVFIDSGTGGLPYLAHLKEKCPQADCVYVADTKNFPYGTKKHEEIVRCAKETVAFAIKEFEPRCIVIACNTISVNALDDLRNAFGNVLFVGTVPAIKLAASVTKNKRIGLLATKSTVENEYTARLKEDFASDCEIVLRDDTELISFIEEKSFTAEKSEIEKACLPAAEFFRKENCDTVILGCTHFLNISGIIQDVFGEKIKVVDSRDGVVNHALEVCKINCEKTVNNKTEKFYNESSKLLITGTSKIEYEAASKRYNLEVL